MTTIEIKCGVRSEKYRLKPEQARAVYDLLDSFHQPAKTGVIITKGMIERAIIRATNVKDIRDKSRKDHIVLARHLYFYYCWKHNVMGLKEIGVDAGGYDHTSVMHGRNNIRKFIQLNDAKVLGAIERVNQFL